MISAVVVTAEPDKPDLELGVTPVTIVVSDDTGPVRVAVEPLETPPVSELTGSVVTELETPPVEVPVNPPVLLTNALDNLVPDEVPETLGLVLTKPDDTPAREEALRELLL